ncbi:MULTISPECIES: cytochrome c biogenesis protein ResB [Arthrobacter]|uniref:Cytochrome c biogenesis protein ResB n=2 Tax=Arthrobacter TaxID=1663 RepID=A0ABU9KKU7_9MICC|nr:cytochrome c biogenesis protein ResB [Arthrobacter sp. YJM1]MDP5227531.1 cytochrome c biogenesis protein ResB [Arthrobacter sp. YJM1]
MTETVKKPKRGRKPEGASSSRQDVAVPALGPIGMLRWAWTQLTSMRTALLLLLLLAVAAVPGSLFPQRPANPAVVTQYLKDHADYGPWLDKLQLFDVYSSYWFSAIYLLLFISLIGCIIPRARAHWKALRTAPPRTPRRISRLPQYGTLVIPAAQGATASSALADAAAVLKGRRYRVDTRDTDGERPHLGAEVGYVREIGNLVFHTSLVGVLVSVAIGGLFGYSGQRTLVEGETFVNTLVGYDQFSPGTDFQSAWLSPYSVQLDKFDVRYDRESVKQFGQPIDFNASVTTKDSPDAPAQKQTLKVNDPLEIGGTGLYLVGNGYAPVITVRDGKGNVALQGPVPAIPTDAVYTSTMVIKVPDAQPDQLGFVGFFLPAAQLNDAGIAYSADPDPLKPQLNLNSYYGDLGLNSGSPQNVYNLDVKNLKQLNGRDLPAKGIVLDAGQTYKLPDGKGSITFDGLKRFIAIDIRHNPGQVPALIFALVAVGGLVISLYTGRRRAWVRTGTAEDGRVMVEYGLLARGEDHGLARETARIRKALQERWGLDGPAGGSTAGTPADNG